MPRVIPLPQARALAAQPLAPRRERVPLEDARGRILAAPLRARRAVPGADCSAMDGYAVRAQATRGANRDHPARFTRALELFAGGAPPRALNEGEAARIFTGAMLPEGADCVIRQEATAEERGEVRVFVEAQAGANVRRRGEELAEGALALPAGCRLDAYALGALATQGLAEVEVLTRPAAAVLAVGDELLPPGAPAAAHQIYDSNGPLLAALAQEAGARVVCRARCGDDEAQLARALEQALADAEVLITAGGASVGERDRVKHALRALGARFLFDGVALKPGKPVALAELSGKRVVVLPGNPGAAAVGFDVIARAVLLSRQGLVEERRRVKALLAQPQVKQPALTYLLSATLEEREGQRWAQPRPRGGGQLVQNVGREGWAHLPAGVGQLAAGDEIELELFFGARLLLAQEAP